MRLHFSDFFDIDPDALEQYGAMNVSLINDLPLFIDPFLLFNSKKPEYQELHRSIIKYLSFLRDKSQTEIANIGHIYGWYKFPEVKQNWLGFSKVGNGGAGLGKDFGVSLHENLHRIFSDFGSEKISMGSHLEKLCLIKDGVGKDKISDFTANLTKEFLLEYTQEFSHRYLQDNYKKKVAVEKVRFNYQTETWERGQFELPYFRNDFVLLTPKDMLTKDDTWINKGELLDNFDEIAIAIPNPEFNE